MITRVLVTLRCYVIWVPLLRCQHMLAIMTASYVIYYGAYVQQKNGERRRRQRTAQKSIAKHLAEGLCGA